ncbi:hypothetical protein ABZS76_33255 [Streptomyces sp. NPDC005562]|uniref:hypothetical protein n=1 Tax=Streptomyces sp. NPDC005562 TaxID=3154890 RepID=UPI0033B2907E
MSTAKNTKTGAPAPAKFGGRGAQAAAARKAAAAAGKPVARRGEENTPKVSDEDNREGQPVKVEVPHPAEPAESETSGEAGPPADVVIPSEDQVVLSREEGATFSYTELPEDMDPLQQIAEAKRGIVRANNALTDGMGKLARDYVLSAGQWLWDVTNRKTYKAAGFKSVDSFAKSVSLERHDVYRLRKAVPVYRDIGDLVAEPLGIRVIEEIFKTKTTEGRREQYRQMKRAGRISAAGAIAARKLLALGEATEIIQTDKSEDGKPAAVDRLNQALKARRIVDTELLAEVKRDNPSAAQSYLESLRESYEAALKIVEGADQKP